MRVILPTKKKLSSQIEFFSAPESLAIATTSGLVKSLNEDRIGFTKKKESLRFFVADGHWGDEASDYVAMYWADHAGIVNSHKDAKIETGKMQNKLFSMLGSPQMDEDKDLTSEAGFVVADIKGDILRIFSYGDCRAFLIRKERPIYDMKTNQTWIGAFSYLGLRKRLPIESALIYKSMRVEDGDLLLLMTDGITECKYGVPTLSKKDLAKLCDGSPEKIVNKVLERVFEEGAEDNASILAYSIAIN